MKKLLSASPLHLEKTLLFLRIAIGVMTAYHGLEVFDPEKMAGYAVWDSFSHFSAPLLPVYVGKSGELFSGLLLTAGLLTRAAALVLVFTMSYIVFFIGQGRVWYEEQHPFLFLLFGVLFFFAGGGKWSADRLLFDRTSSNFTS